MGFTGIWLRVDLPRRWRQLAVLVLLVAISTGTVLTAVAGARRGASAADRLVARTGAATAVVRANTVKSTDAGWARIRALPQVVAVTRWSEYTGFGIDEAPGDPVQQYIPTDSSAMTQVERPVVLVGRLADPADPHQAVVTENFLHTWHLGVGDRVTLRLFSSEQVINGVSAIRNLPRPRLDGPVVRVQIVGVVRSPFFGDAVGDPGRLFPSPALFAAYPWSILEPADPWLQTGLVTLAGGDDDLGAFRDQVRSIPLWQDANVVPRSPLLDHARHVARFEAACLLAFAGVALIVALVMAGLLIARLIGSISADLMRMRAVGLSRAQAISAAAAGPIIAGALGAPAGALLAVLGSRWMPFGAAATLEPAPGTDVDWLVLPAGVAVAIGVVTGVALASARSATRFRPDSLLSQVFSSRPSPVLSAGRGLPVPVVLGSRFALEPEAGTGRSPVGRALRIPIALVAAMVGVAGVAAAGTFAAAVRDAARNPVVFGQPDTVTIGLTYQGQPGADPAAVMAKLRQDRDVTAVIDGPFNIADSAAGTVNVFSSDPQAVIQPSMISGRAPVLPGEVALTPDTARKLDTQLGSTIALTGDRSRVELKVTGVGLVPQSQYSDYDSGAWVSTLGYGGLFKGFLVHFLRVTLRPGADINAFVARYRSATHDIPLADATFVSASTRPPRMAEMRDLEPIPLALAVFLAVLAIGTTGSSLASSLRRHRRDVAVLRAVGMTPRQSRTVARTHAVVLAVVALAIGMPLGLGIGRTLWRLVADSTPLIYHPPMAVLLLVAIAAVTVVIMQVLAWPVSRRTARLRVADVLRTE